MKKFMIMSSMLLLLMPVLSLGAEGFYGNMYRGSYYYTTFFTEIGEGASASLKNLDSYDDGVGDVYMQNYMDIH